MLRRTPFKKQAMPERKPMEWPGKVCFAPAARCDDMGAAQPKEPPPMRDKEYRRLVASLECYACRVQQHSQAAHPNTGKAKGVKLCDLDVFPMCTVGAKDCHGKFDRYELVQHEEMPAYERAAKAWTVRTLLARGLWPARLAIPDLREFDA